MSSVRSVGRGVGRADVGGARAVFVVDAAQQVLTGRTSDEEGGELFTLPIHSGIAGYVALTGEAVNLKDVAEDKRFDPSMDRKTNRRSRCAREPGA